MSAPTQDQIVAAAAAFVAELRATLLPREIGLVRARNRAETSPNVCHSQDFCDANMVMDAALRRLGYDVDASDLGATDDFVTQLWNAAWEHARKETWI